MTGRSIDQTNADTLAAHGWTHDTDSDDFSFYVHAELEGERIRIEGRGWVHFKVEGRPLAHSRYGRKLADYLDDLHDPPRREA